MNGGASRRLVSTRTADVTPLGTAGQRSFELIRREVAALGPDAAALFAEPFATPEGDAVDWYGEGAGPASRLDDAPEPQQGAARATLDRLVAAVTARADALIEDRDEERRRLGEALRNAVEVPGEDCIHVIGDQPVLVCWAHRSNAARPRVGVLTRRLAAIAPAAAQAPVVAAQAPAPVAAAPVAVAPRGFGWLWWLLWGAVGALAVAVAVLLLPACGIAGGGWLDRCPAPTGSAAAPETDRSAALLAQLETLQRRLRDDDRMCRPERQVLLCPADRPRQTTLLLDASASMGFSMGLDPAIDRGLWDLSRKARPDGSFADPADARRYEDLTRQARATPGARRIDVARQALIRALEQADFPPVRLGAFSGCGRTRLDGPFADADAARAAIERVAPKPYTALAEAIALGAQTMEGGLTPDDPVGIVLVSDGYDTCGGDPCAAARAAKAARPGLRIDVIDLVGLPDLQCVADLTGGSYQVAQPDAPPDALAALIAKSARLPVPPGCAPPRDHAALPPEQDDFDRRVTREQGAANGPLQITLIWETVSDLDLALHCPGGGKIYFRNRQACGGVLDIDQNDSGDLIRAPVENIAFAAPPAPGRYRVEVRNFKQRGPAPNPFQLRIVKDGRSRIEQGRLARSGEAAEFTFDYP